MNNRATVFPDPAAIGRLALSDSGFVFDPVTGRSYTVNVAGLAVLRLLQKQTDLPQVLKAMQEQFEGDATVIECDVIEFAGVLRSQVK